MKDKITVFSFGVVAVICYIYFDTISSYNTELEKIIDRKDAIIKSSQEKDSVLKLTSKEYAEKVTKYINNCEFDINGNIISAEKMIKIFAETNDKLHTTKDSLKAYKQVLNDYRKERVEDSKVNSKNLEDYLAKHDSLMIYKLVVDYCKKEYGLNYKINKDGNDRVVSYSVSKADSALMVYKYYKHKLSSDKPGSFIIEVEGNEPQKVRPKRKN